jgi:hypothetical protein
MIIASVVYSGINESKTPNRLMRWLDILLALLLGKRFSSENQIKALRAILPDIAGWIKAGIVIRPFEFKRVNTSQRDINELWLNRIDDPEILEAFSRQWFVDQENRDLFRNLQSKNNLESLVIKFSDLDLIGYLVRRHLEQTGLSRAELQAKREELERQITDTLASAGVSHSRIKHAFPLASGREFMRDICQKLYRELGEIAAEMKEQRRQAIRGNCLPQKPEDN